MDVGVPSPNVLDGRIPALIVFDAVLFGQRLSLPRFRQSVIGGLGLPVNVSFAANGGSMAIRSMHSLLRERKKGRLSIMPKVRFRMFRWVIGGPLNRAGRVAGCLIVMVGIWNTCVNAEQGHGQGHGHGLSIIGHAQ